MNRYLTILAGLVIFIVAFGCRQKPSAETETERAEPNAPAQIDTKAVEPKQVAKAAADEVAVTVDGVAITEKEIEAEIKQLPPAYLQRNKERTRQQVLDRMIAMRLIDEKSKAAQITITEEDVRAQVNEIAAQQGMSVEEFKKMLQSRGMNYDEWEQQIRWGVKLGKLVEAEFGDQLKITENDANNSYTSNIQRFETPEQVRASHILIKPDTTDPNVDPNEAKAKALAKAQDMLKQAKEEGADFAELALANSDCLSKAKGGDLGFRPRGAWDASFDKAAFALKVDEVSGVVETQLGYHIIKVTDRKEAGVKPFEQARDEIVKMLKQRKQRELFAKYLTQIRAEASIIYPPGKEPPPVTPGP